MNQETKTYEGMFLVDTGKADFSQASQPVQSILDRNQVQVIAIKPWDERRLAYEVSGRKRALYVLTYFKADPLSITAIEHDCNLSDDILRVLILKRDNLTDEQIQTKTPAERAEESQTEPYEAKDTAAPAPAPAPEPPREQPTDETATALEQ